MIYTSNLMKSDVPNCTPCCAEKILSKNLFNATMMTIIILFSLSLILVIIEFLTRFMHSDTFNKHKLKYIMPVSFMGLFLWMWIQPMYKIYNNNNNVKLWGYNEALLTLVFIWMLSILVMIVLQYAPEADEKEKIFTQETWIISIIFIAMFIGSLVLSILTIINKQVLDPFVNKCDNTCDTDCETDCKTETKTQKTK